MVKKNIKKIVKKWCDEEGIFEDEKEEKLNEFLFTINYPIESGDKLNLFQPLGSDKLIIMGGVQFDEKIIEKMRSLPSEELDKLLWDLRFSLASRPTEFNLNRPDETIIEAFVTSTVIFPDGLTKDRFMTAISEVYKSKLIGTWKIRAMVEQ